MHKIIIIGTQPPCPRCRLLTEIVTKKSAQIELDSEISHISYTSEEARGYAKAAGLEAGTAKDVARKLGMEVDLNIKLDESDKSDLKKFDNLEACLEPLNQLMKEVAILDNRLRNFENRALEFGIMMTPVLIIDYEIKHQGSIPDLSKIEQWLSGCKE